MRNKWDLRRALEEKESFLVRAEKLLQLLHGMRGAEWEPELKGAS